ncbi:MAG TPA: T9SS type A sorting domain-containing protein [Ohtaekwangia sp.]|uniref:T9SS type A sorting domain-containing protein n=1 Tax=Ohtaekwangia sp. TaxID=2066019 RepID=UPI002F95FA81
MRFITICLLAIITGHASAQSSGDFRTAQTGDWSSASTWESFNGTSWVAASSAPSSSNGTITILSGHTVTVPGGVTVTADQLVVQGNLTIALTGQLTLNDGASTDMTITSPAVVQVSGVLSRSNGSTIDNSSNASTLVFSSGSEYRHNYTTTVGSLPTATWDKNSTVSILGFTNTTTITADNTWAQALGHVVFNSTGQRGIVDFAGNLNTILGDFTVLNTGTNVLQLSASENPTITIGSSSDSFGGDILISGTSRVNFSTDGSNTHVIVYGNFGFNSSNVTGSSLTLTGTTTVDVYGDFSMNATANGKLHMANTGTTGNTTLNLYGNFSLQTGRIDELGSEPAQGSIRFLGSGSYTYLMTGSISGHINYYISSATTLDLSIYPMASSTPGTFQLDGTMVVGSQDVGGAIQLVVTGGNIRTVSTYRTYSSGSVIIYRSSGAQYMGPGQPTGTGITTVIDNSSGVSLTGNRTIGGVIRLESGFLNLNNFALTSSGTMEVNAGVLKGTSTSSLFITGTTGGTWGTIKFDPLADTVGTLTINRSGTSGQVDLNSTVVVKNQLNLTQGILNNTSGLTMANNALITRYETSSISGQRPVITSGSYGVYYRSTSASYDTGLELPDPTNATSLGGLTFLLAQIAHNVNLTQNITINGNVALNRGIFNLQSYTVTMKGSAWSDNAGNLTPSTSLIIFDGATSAGGTTNPLFGNIQLNSGKSLAFTRSFVIQGNINFATGSSFDMSTFTATLSGANAQTISVNGTTFSNITVAKSGSAGVQLTSALNLSGLLQFGSPSTNVNFASNGHLTLLSTTDASGSGTAMIMRLQSGNTVSGDVTVQRYMSGEGRIYRYISSPVSNATVAQWKDDFPVTGNFSDPSPKQTICGYYVTPSSASLFYYDETVAGDINQGYVAYPLPGTTSAASALQVGRGYTTFIRQCTNPTLIDVTGTINQGTITFPLTYTNNDASASGWNLVGNPYPATIDWDVTGWSKTRMSTIIAVTDNGSGMTRYYDAGVTEDIPNGQIAVGQAFWVRATGASPILRITEGVKVSTVAEFYRVGIKESFVVSLSNGELRDAAYVKIQDDAVAGIDEFDAPKINNPTFSFSTISDDNVPMAINALSGLDCGKIMKLGLKVTDGGTYTIAFDKRGYFDNFNFILIDHYLNKEVDIVSNAYTFTIGDEASQAFDRFSLRLEEKLPDVSFSVNAPVSVEASKVYTVELGSSEVGVNYALLNEADQIISTSVSGTGKAIAIPLVADSLDEGQNTLHVMATQSCTYALVNTSFAVEKQSIESSSFEKMAGIKAYPNPVSGKLTIQRLDEDVRQIEIKSIVGQTIYRSTLTDNTQDITVDFTSYASGMYILVVDKGTSRYSYQLQKK